MKQFTQFAVNALACVRCTTLEETEVAIFGFVIRWPAIPTCQMRSAMILRGGKPGEMNRPLRFGTNRNLHVSRAFYIHLPKNGE